MLQVLLAVPQIDACALDRYRRTPLHDAAHCGCANAVRALIKRSDINVNAADVDRWTPLHFACHASADAVKALLAARNLNVNAVEVGGWTALHMAARYGYSRVAKLHVPTIDVNAGRARAENIDERTPLHLAVKFNHHAMVKVLVAVRIIHVNAADNVGRTPLHPAAKIGSCSAAKALLAMPSVDVNAVTFVPRKGTQPQ